MLVDVNKLFVFKSFWQCFAFSTQVNFPTNNLNFQWRWLDWIQAIFLNLFYFINQVKFYLPWHGKPRTDSYGWIHLTNDKRYFVENFQDVKQQEKDRLPCDFPKNFQCPPKLVLANHFPANSSFPFSLWLKKSVIK